MKYTSKNIVKELEKKKRDNRGRELIMLASNTNASELFDLLGFCKVVEM